MRSTPANPKGIEHPPALPEVFEVVLVEFTSDLQQADAAPIGVDAAALPVMWSEIPHEVAAVAATPAKLIEYVFLVGVTHVIGEGDVVEVDVAHRWITAAEDGIDLLGDASLGVAHVNGDGEQAPAFVLAVGGGKQLAPREAVVAAAQLAPCFAERLEQERGVAASLADVLHTGRLYAFGRARSGRFT